MKEMRNFVAFHRIKLARLDKTGDMLSEERLVKSEFVDKRSLSDKHVRSMMGSSVSFFYSFSFPFIFIRIPPLQFCLLTNGFPHVL